VPEENFWTFMVQGKINRGRHTDHSAGRHSIRTNQCPPPPSPTTSDYEINFNDRLPGEHDISSSATLSRKRTSGDKWQSVYKPDALPVIEPTASKQRKELKALASTTENHSFILSWSTVGLLKEGKFPALSRISNVSTLTMRHRYAIKRHIEAVDYNVNQRLHRDS